MGGFQGQQVDVQAGGYMAYGWMPNVRNREINLKRAVSATIDECGSERAFMAGGRQQALTSPSADYMNA